MTSRLTSHVELVDALMELNVPIPDRATVAQLRRLYTLTMGNPAAADRDASEDEQTDIDSVETLDVADVNNADPAVASAAPAVAPAAHAVAFDAAAVAAAFNAGAAAAAAQNRIAAGNVRAVDKAAAAAHNHNELEEVRARYEILRIRRQIESMEQGAAPEEDAVGQRADNGRQANARQVSFRDIEHAVMKFSGEDRALGVTDFLRQLELVLDQVDADNTLRFLTLRNSLSGAALLLLTQGDLTYDALKANLIREFGHSVGRHAGESIRRYVMEMEVITRRRDIDDAELMVFVQEGLAGTATDGAFSSANDMNDIKRAIVLFERRQAVKEGADRRTTASTQQRNGDPTSQRTASAAETQIADRCFNCSRMGHRKPSCPYEVRPVNVCYNCWRVGHDRKACPNIQYEQKLKPVVAAVSGSEGVDDALSAINLVSVAFTCVNNRWNNIVTCTALFDTGSPVSLLRRDAVPVAACFKNFDELNYTQYRGLGGRLIA